MLAVVVTAATAVSIFIGSRSMIETASAIRVRQANTAQGDIERTGEEIEGLLADLSTPTSPNLEGGIRRDPMVPYTPPPKPSPQHTTQAPRPSYKVSAVFLGVDPYAVLVSGGTTIQVHIGTELDGGVVTAIEADGVRVQTGSGEEKWYPFSP
jgi:hypothetical protein